MLALQFVITLRAGGDVRLVCECLELSGLSVFVGASDGSQQGVNAALQPVSGFILLVQSVADRTAATWTQALRAACTP